MLLFSPFTEETGMNTNTHFCKCLMLQRSCKSLIRRINIGTTFCVSFSHMGNFLPITRQGSTIVPSQPPAPTLARGDTSACLPSSFGSTDLTLHNQFALKSTS